MKKNSGMLSLFSFKLLGAAMNDGSFMTPPKRNDSERLRIIQMEMDKSKQNYKPKQKAKPKRKTNNYSFVYGKGVAVINGEAREKGWRI